MVLSASWIWIQYYSYGSGLFNHTQINQVDLIGTVPYRLPRTSKLLANVNITIVSNNISKKNLPALLKKKKIFVGILKAIERESKIRRSVIRGSGSVSKRYGSDTAKGV
jgi:hypothetical protein